MMKNECINKKAMQAKYNCMHGGARVGGCDCDEQAHKGERLMTSPCWPRRGLLLTLSRRVAVQRPDARFGLSWEAWGDGGRHQIFRPCMHMHACKFCGMHMHAIKFGQYRVPCGLARVAHGSGPTGPAHGPVLSTPQSLDCSLDKLPQLFPK